MRTKRAGLEDGAGIENVLSPSAVAFSDVTALYGPFTASAA